MKPRIESLSLATVRLNRDKGGIALEVFTADGRIIVQTLIRPSDKDTFTWADRKLNAVENR